MIIFFLFSFLFCFVFARAIRICPETTPLADMKYPTVPPNMALSQFHRKVHRKKDGHVWQNFL